MCSLLPLLYQFYLELLSLGPELEHTSTILGSVAGFCATCCCSGLHLLRSLPVTSLKTTGVSAEGAPYGLSIIGVTSNVASAVSTTENFTSLGENTLKERNSILETP